MSPSDGIAITDGSAPRARSHTPSTRALWRATKRFLYFFHRWTGIVLCVFFAVWFVSGVVMMYVPFPSFRAPERIAGAAPIDWARVRVTPDAVLTTLRESAFPKEMRLGMSGDVPVYRVVTEDGRRAISAETGQEIRAVDAPQAGAIAAAFGQAPVASIVAVRQDQWVVTRAYKKIAPFWRIRLADPAATDVYVMQQTGEIVQNTTAHERFWNWLGAVPHWIYFEALRVYQEPWRQTVLWTSGVGMLGAIAGIWIGLLRVRISKRYKSGSVSPYRSWMKWHHVVGLVGGVFVVTWVFSGWLSMSPWGGFRDEDKGIAERYVGAKPGFATTDLRGLAGTARDARELEFSHLGGIPVIVAWRDPEHKRLLDGATAEPISLAKARIETIARSAVTDGKLMRTESLEHYDRYWYATGDPRRDARPLPVLRLVFDDANQTWLHIDPATGLLLGRAGSGSRSYRWLFAALHSFDLPFLLEHRMLRDLLMWLLSAAGLIVSVSGVVIGWRRLRPVRSPAQAVRLPGGR